MQNIDQKLKAIQRERFFRVHLRRLAGLFVEDWPKAGGCLVLIFFQVTSPDAGGAFCKELTKSRRLSGAALFRAIAAGYLGSLAVGGKRQLEADGRKHFSGAHLQRLAGPFVEY